MIEVDLTSPCDIDRLPAVSFA